VQEDQEQIGVDAGIDAEVATAKSLQPQALVSYRVDPFSSFARRVNDREAFLLDYYVHDLIQHFKGHDNATIHPPRDVCFRTNVTTGPSMDVMLAYASAHLARRYPYAITSHDEAERYKLRGIQDLTTAIADPDTRVLDSTVIAVVGLIAAQLEIRRDRLTVEEKNEVAFHIRGLRNLIIARGGFPEFIRQSTVQWIVTWFDLTTWGALSVGWTPLSDHYSTLSLDLYSPLYIPGPRSSRMVTPHPSDIQTLGLEYVAAFGNFHREALRREHSLRTAQNTHSTFNNSNFIQVLFRRGTLMHHVLTTASCIVSVPAAAALLLLNLLLWDRRSFTLQSNLCFFKQLRMSMVEEGIDLGGSVDLLIWVLMTERGSQHKVRDPERIWLLARLLHVYNHLPKDLQEHSDTILLRFLTGDATASTPTEPGPDREPELEAETSFGIESLANWDFDSFRWKVWETIQLSPGVETSLFA
jgi:hypothetical protein